MDILLHDDVGKYASNETKEAPQLCWHSIRNVARCLKCELNVGEVTSSNVRDAADKIKNFMAERDALTSPQVLQEIGDISDFFAAHQLDKVGGLGEKLALPEDSDAEGCEETV